MDLFIGLFITFCALTFSIYKGLFVGYPLLLGFFMVAFIVWRRGFLLKDIVTMSYIGGKKAFVVLKIFILIGGITSIWMASGTVPAIVYYGMRYMNPDYFILYAFLISCGVSFLLGTSFGTVSTVGVAFILMAKSGNVNPNIAAGAIIAGAYFGDRCSPMSSSANLVANLTGTDLYKNIPLMFKTSVIPFILSIILYLVFSLKSPLQFMSSGMDAEIIHTFNTHWLVLLPAIIILLFAFLKINVKVSMSTSIILASIIAITFQNQDPIDVFKYLFMGFQLDSNSPLQAIIKGGGILSMWKASLVVFISCALAGIFDGTNMLKNIERILMKGQTHYQLLMYTTIVSIVTGAAGCSQSISIVLTNQLMKKSYEDKGIALQHLAIDLENTGIVLSALIPWNIAAFVPTTTMAVSNIGFIPYAFYLYLVPICSIIFLKFSKTKASAK